MEHKRVMITTLDNPFDCFKDFDSWFLFDIEHGYNTCAYLARIAKTSEQFSDYENDLEIERAIDEIISIFPGMYKKVYSED